MVTSTANYHAIRSFSLVLPLINSPTFITQGYCDCTVFAQVEVIAIVVVIRRNPSDPHASRVLASKDPYRVVILKGQMGNLVKTGWSWSK